MSTIHELCRGHKRLRPLIEFAMREGWQVSRTAGGHLRFVKPGLPPIFTASTASDHRASQNAWSRLRRAVRNRHGGPNG